MSSRDPRILISVLRNLEDEIERFTQESSETLRQVEYAQRCAQERVQQAQKWQAVVADQVSSNSESVEEKSIVADEFLRQCDEAIDVAHETISSANAAKERADATLAHWNNELQLALAWQERAEIRVAAAERAYAQAKSNFESAQRDLERANANLRRCNNDSERRDCRSEARACDRALAALEVAALELDAAETELQEARIELELARARVRCCREAVGYSEEAVEHAASAQERANEALNYAERGQENAKSASRASDNALAKTNQAEDEAEQAGIKIGLAEDSTQQAFTFVQSARNMNDSAHRLSRLGIRDLGDRVSSLIKLNEVSSDSL